MDGRWFDERQLEAYVADGSEKFKKSNKKKGGDVEDEDGENSGGGDGVGGEGDRLDKFGKWLEEEKNNSKRDDQQEN